MAEAPREGIGRDPRTGRGAGRSGSGPRRDDARAQVSLPLQGRALRVVRCRHPAAVRCGRQVQWGSQQRPGHLVNILVGPDNETLSLPWTATPERVRDSGGLVATALAALLAKGLAVPDAATQACRHAELALAQAFQPGMGQRIARRFPAAPESTALVS